MVKSLVPEGTPLELMFYSAPLDLNPWLGGLETAEQLKRAAYRLGAYGIYIVDSATRVRVYRIEHCTSDVFCRAAAAQETRFVFNMTLADALGAPQPAMPSAGGPDIEA